MSEGEALDWGITGVGVLPGDRKMHEVLHAQDCLYTLVVKDPDGTMHPRVIGSIVDYLFAPDDPDAVLRVMTDPATRIVSLTVTEGGYHVNQATGEFDDTDPAIQQRPRGRARSRARRSASSWRRCAAGARRARTRSR